MLPQTPSEPLPFFAAVQAWHVPLHTVLQQTPSVQKPLPQSLLTLHCLAIAQVVPHELAVPPPQSTSVSVPSFVPELQLCVPKQPSVTVPHVLPSALHVLGVQPQKKGVPGFPPPQVLGETQALSLAQPHCPLSLQAPLTPQGVFGGSLGFVGAPPLQISFVQRLPSTGLSVLSTSGCAAELPAPSQTTTLQSPTFWKGAARGVPAAT